MKVIIAGSRGITDAEMLDRAIAASGFDITELVTGACPSGVDAMGEAWADARRIPKARFPYEKEAGRAGGVIRNGKMADYAEALIAVWDLESYGTADMIRKARRKRLKLHLHNEALLGAGWEQKHVQKIVAALAEIPKKPFDFTKVSWVTDPELWRQSLIGDAMRGPRGYRSRSGIFQEDIRLLLTMEQRGFGKPVDPERIRRR